MTIQVQRPALGNQSLQIAHSYPKFNEDILTTSYHKMFFFGTRKRSDWRNLL